MLVVFDWDGTLIDSTAKIVRSMQTAAQLVGLPILKDDAVRNIIGLGLPEAVFSLYPEASLEKRNALRHAYSDVYLGKEQMPCALYDGVEQVLHDLRQAGFRLAVATGKSRRGLDRALQELDWLDYFDATRCADETASKPNPLMLEQLMTELAVPASDTIMVGDTEFDLAMASNAGVASVGVSYGAHAAERLFVHKPLAVIDHFLQLPTVILRR